MAFVPYTLFALVQWTWGLPQTLLGALLTLRYARCRHRFMNGALVTYHNGTFGGVSLGMFVFVSASRPGKWTADAEVHEYGHALQSLLLGPLYLFVIGLPSALWCGLGICVRYRREHAVSYYAFYPEKWANAWGAAATGRPRPTWADDVAAEDARRIAAAEKEKENDAAAVPEEK